MTTTTTTPEAPVASISSHQTLSASYRSPSNAEFANIHKIPTPLPNNPADKAAYLKALRAAVVTLQETVNAELTARMDEDKSLEASTKSGAEKLIGLDEAKEEDNYGEEVLEED